MSPCLIGCFYAIATAANQRNILYILIYIRLVLLTSSPTFSVSIVVVDMEKATSKHGK